MDTTTLFIALFFSSIGIGYFIYGKKQQRVAALFAGVALCVFPYFVSSVILLIILGIILVSLPFFLRF